MLAAATIISFCFVIYVVSFSVIRDHMVIAYAEKKSPQKLHYHIIMAGHHQMAGMMVY